MNVEELLKKQTSKKKEAAASKKTEVDDSAELDEAGKKEIQDVIANNKIVVFSKSYCPYCRQAKMTFNSIDNPKLEYKVVEMDDGSHNGWQAHISEIAKTMALECAKNNNTKSVPQIFINQKYIGGADDLADLYANKSLAEMLGREIK
ncbi:Glutaredoxin-2 [Seminavis robusta]|uniref:Glutaredoxin-2 n=1 Tax=Seminavis robusta TaxID=568900 RepID=A0A9N8E0X0_9STRA|nr:Glutaredoxin-2 [Seminavis robusta]|eukprot:Sro426_g140280.1 Glutaredoxin-2 (148) ;mRNA; r:7433-7876